MEENIKEYSVKILGLDCPNCAKSLEKALEKLENVNSVKIDFLHNKLSFATNFYDKAIKNIVKTTKEIEPDAKIEEEISGEKFAENESKNTQNDDKKISKNSEKKAKNSEKKGQEKDKIFTKKTFLIEISLLILGIALGICALYIEFPAYIYWTLFCLGALLVGYKTYLKAFKQILRGIINENFLVTLSIIGATAVGEHMEGFMVIVLYTIGKVLESLAVNKSRKSIAELTNLKPDYAIKINGNEETKVLPQDLNLGDIIIVRAGEKVAIDGVVIEGNATLDKQSLTGESLPQVVKVNEEILSGSIVLDGVLKIKTTTLYSQSTVNKILNLIENAQDKKSKTETVISKVARFYTLGVIIVSILVFGIVFAVLKNFNTALYRALIFLVVSCPCAFAISVPLSYFSGLGNASKKGILIKGSNYLDALAKINMLAFDKTGTLTTGKFVVEKIIVKDASLTQNDILHLASVGEQYSLHPLAKSIVEAYTIAKIEEDVAVKNTKEEKLEASKNAINIKENENIETDTKIENIKKLEIAKNIKEIAGKGVEFEYKNEQYFVGRKSKNLEGTVVELFKNDKLLGEIYLKDNLKSSSKKACLELKKLGIKTLLLSGDNEKSVEKVAQELEISEFHASLLPQDKFTFIENAKKSKNFIGFVGDGINDSPTLTLADVGISMGLNGSTASIEASDVVLVDDNIEKIITAMKVSKFTRKIVWQNIILSAGIKLIFLTLGAIGITGMLSAVIADVGVTLIAIFNSLRALKYKGK